MCAKKHQLQESITKGITDSVIKSDEILRQKGTFHSSHRQDFLPGSLLPAVYSWFDQAVYFGKRIHYCISQLRCQSVVLFQPFPCMLQLKKNNKLLTAPVSPNLQAETFTGSAHGTYVRHPNVISPPRTDSLRLLQHYSL